MHNLILAAVNPDNTPHGYNWTFAFPMLMFIIIGGILYLLFSRPHRRVPARTLTLTARRPGAPSGATASTASAASASAPAPAPAAETAEEPADAAPEAAAGTDGAPSEEGSE